MRAEIAVLGSLTFPGKPEHVAMARAFVTRTLGDDCPQGETAVLLTSELVTNSIRHSHSGREGGTITVTLITIPGGVRAEVIDDGGGASAPALRADRANAAQGLLEGGLGLQLVQMLSARWHYWQDEAGTVTWFELTEPVL
jgi:anti-sigma regulatory factor (Ser/Thr protein kinase)